MVVMHVENKVAKESVREKGEQEEMQEDQYKQDDSIYWGLVMAAK